MERDLVEQATLLNTREEYIAWEQRCDEFIESLEEQSRIKRPRLPTGNRQSVIACIARLGSLKDSVRGRFVHVGAGYGLRWREIETAFESRILTDAVINSNYVEPRRFPEDASKIVIESMQCVLQRYDSLKINTVFNGEFVTDDKRPNNSITTRNHELYQCTDLREWYMLSLEEFQERHRGWALSRILNLTVNANKLNPLRMGCHIKLPREIMLKRTVINVRSTDNGCFAWSMIAALHPYAFEACTVIFLDYIRGPTVRIGKLNDYAIRLPSEENKWLSFRNHYRTECVPFVIYADLEGALEKMASDSQFVTHMYQYHNVFSIGYYVHYSYDSSLSGYRFRRDKDCIAWFAEELKNLAHSVQSTTSDNVPMADFTRDDWEKFNSALHCHVCEEPFTPDDARVRDHCHSIGRYRGPAHSNCNLNYKDSHCILDISETCLYEFHHEYTAPLFRDKCKIMYTDTDSLIYHVECDDVYDIMKRDINRFDTSDYSIDNAYDIPLANKKVPGLMKDGNNGAVMTDFVGLRAKMCALRVQGKKDTGKAKDIKSSVVAKSITFEDYTRCLNDAIEMTRRQSCIRSILHEVYHDDKRYIVSDSTDTLLWGHYRCK
ncbi:hypothetical protein ALC60_09013 [Trachymyrmex zeteki]|uniref:DNA-directed DNA polymerase n=1 Tax=Mycetomoellerius zeteki TaxID=64791 RepID=A0A151WVE5_9HYME|nr:hypothetical protein ALC60_09013 [Trachymyrmex zeteki]